MGAQQQHAFTLGERRIEMLAADNGNFRLKFAIGSYNATPISTQARKKLRSEWRATPPISRGTQAVAQGDANIGDRTITKSAKKVKPDLG